MPIEWGVQLSDTFSIDSDESYFADVVVEETGKVGRECFRCRPVEVDPVANIRLSITIQPGWSGADVP